uniref:Uncharacterized protein n=1 Tax=Bosea sp. NBC_00436 TaxID=2969620 RepID=A0A9E7ZLC8_9HYPH
MTAAYVAEPGLLAERSLWAERFIDARDELSSTASVTAPWLDYGCQSRGNITAGPVFVAVNGVGSIVALPAGKACTGMALRAHAVYSKGSTPEPRPVHEYRDPRPGLRKPNALVGRELGQNVAERIVSLMAMKRQLNAFRTSVPDEAVGDKLVQFTLGFARALPLDVNFPRITFSDDQEIVLTWFDKNGRLEAIIQPDGYITWVSSYNKKYSPGGDYALSDRQAVFKLLLSVREFCTGETRA